MAEVPGLLKQKSACFVAVHVGAGYHSVQHEGAYNQALKQACSGAASAPDCLTGVTTAIQSLEANTCTNAGIGSNLTLTGRVEEDASIKLGDGTFGAVGAVPGIGSAIEVAAHLATESKQPLSLRRVRPIFLAGEQARLWAASRHLQTADSPESLAKWHISQRALQQWNKYKAMLEMDAAKKECQNITAGLPQDSCTSQASGQKANEASPGIGLKRKATQAGLDCVAPINQKPTVTKEGTLDHADQAAAQSPETEATATQSTGTAVMATEDDPLLHDTVGAIFVDAAGRVGAGVSSGGLAMKTPGRVGEAAMYACGCWAADADPTCNRLSTVPKQTDLDPANGANATRCCRLGTTRKPSPLVPANAAALRPGVACSVSGVGEMIMKACLSRECCTRMLDLDVSVDEACAKVIRDTCQQEKGPRDCGLIAVRVVQVDSSNCRQIRVEFAAVHCSKSMGFAYFQLPEMGKPVSQILRQQFSPGSALRLSCSGCVYQWDMA